MIKINELKSNLHIYAAVIFIILSAINFIIYAAGLCFKPINSNVYFAVLIAAFIAYEVCTIVLKNVQTQLSKIFAALSFVPMFIYLVSNVFTINAEKRMLYILILLMIASIIGATGLMISLKCDIFRFIAFAICCVFITLQVLFLFFYTLFDSFVSSEALEGKYSPDGSRYAWVVVYDQGATGGSKRVFVRNSNHDIPLGIGFLKSRIFSPISGMGYLTPADIEWKDNTTLW